jgi:hypothetical protein
MAAPQPKRDRSASSYYYRRDLSARELLVPALIGAGIGMAAFYLARIVEQRTPLVPMEDRSGPRRDRGTRPHLSSRA